MKTELDKIKKLCGSVKLVNGKHITDTVLICNIYRDSSYKIGYKSVIPYFERQKNIVDYISPTLSATRFSTLYESGSAFAKHGKLFPPIYMGPTRTSSFLISWYHAREIEYDNDKYNDMIWDFNKKRIADNLDTYGLDYVFDIYQHYRGYCTRHETGNLIYKILF